MVRLYPYQVCAVEALRGRLRAGLKRLLLVAPTGSGKTVIAAHILERAVRRGSRVLFIAHRRELIKQTLKKLIKAGVPEALIGIMMGRHELTRPNAPVQIASVDTLRRRDLPAAALVIVDEAHRSLAVTYVKIIDHYVGLGTPVIGMTATPFRGNGGGLGDVYEEIVLAASPSELVAQGYIMAPRVFSGTDKDLQNALRGMRVRGGDYVESDLADVMAQSILVGNIVSDWKQHAAGMRTVAFGVNVAHSILIRDRFLSEGIAAEHIDANTPNEERAAVLERVKDGTTLIVCNCGILCEGWDEPAVKCAILARPTKSPVLCLQQSGRILRPWEGVVPILLDHACNVLAHGFPQDDRNYTLKPKPPSDGNVGAPVKVCPECHEMVPVACAKCPGCGCVFEDQRPLPQENGEQLTEIKPRNEKELRDGWNAILSEWEDANKLRAERGERALKPGFIWHRFRERFHVKPPSDCKLPHDSHATPEEKAAELVRLNKVRQERGFKPAWVLHAFKERFGHLPGY